MTSSAPLACKFLVCSERSCQRNPFAAKATWHEGETAALAELGGRSGGSLLASTGGSFLASAEVEVLDAGIPAGRQLPLKRQIEGFEFFYGADVLKGAGLGSLRLQAAAIDGPRALGKRIPGNR